MNGDQAKPIGNKYQIINNLMLTKELPSHLYTQIGRLGINDQTQPGLQQAVDNATYCLTEMGLKDIYYFDSATSALVVGACLTFKGNDLQTHKNAIGSLLIDPNYLNPPEQIIIYDPPKQAKPKRKPVPIKERVSLKNGPLQDYQEGYFPTRTIANLEGRYVDLEWIEDTLRHVPIMISSLNSSQFIEKQGCLGFYYHSAINLPYDFETRVLHHELTHTLGMISISCKGLPDYENFIAADELTVEALHSQIIQNRQCRHLERFKAYDWIREAFANNLPNLPIDVLVKQFSAMYKHYLHASDTYNFIKSLIDQFDERNLARLFQLCRLSTRKSSHLPTGITIDPSEWGPGKTYW